MGKIISVCNQKGGVGKTTTSVNLAASLAMLGKRVLLIDLDPQGNVSKGIGIDRATLNYCVEDVLIDEINPKEAIIESKYKNLFVMPSTIHLAGADLVLFKTTLYEYKLKTSLEMVKDQFDYIFIDCPPSLGRLTINALTASDSVLIPLQCEYYALEGVNQLFASIRKINKNLNKSLEIEGMLLTMFDARTNIGLSFVECAKKKFGNLLFKVVISRNVKLAEAPSFGEPITVFDSKSRGAEAYLKLAHEIIENNK